MYFFAVCRGNIIKIEFDTIKCVTESRKITHYKVLREQLNRAMKKKKKKMKGAEITTSCAESIFRKLTRYVTGDANVRISRMLEPPK